MDKPIDKLVSKIFDKIDLESPSEKFTSNIMTTIKESEFENISVYQPLISKKIWFLALFIIVLFYAIVLIFIKPVENNSFNVFDLSFLDNNFFNFFSNFSISKISLTAILFLSALIFVQIPLLKIYFEKNLKNTLN
jgi:hypothetical protein